MATKYFCDICNRDITPQEEQHFWFLGEKEYLRGFTPYPMQICGICLALLQEEVQALKERIRGWQKVKVQPMQPTA